MADPHFMYRQQHSELNPKDERRKSSTKSWAKRSALGLLLVGAIGITAYSFASSEVPAGAISLNAAQTAKGAAVVIATSTGNVWVNNVVCSDKLSANGCEGSGWLNLGGDYLNPSIAVRSGSTTKYHIVALGRDDKAYFTDVECAPNCAVQASKTTPIAWQAVPNQVVAAQQVVAFTPLSPPKNANCEGTVILEKAGAGKVYESATCSNGANSGELKPVVLKLRTDVVDADSPATKNIASAYTSDNFGRQVLLQTKSGTISQLGDFGYNDQPFVREESVMTELTLKQSSHPFVIQGSPGVTQVTAYGIKANGEVNLFRRKADGSITASRVLTSVTNQKDLYAGLGGFVTKDPVNKYSFVYPANPSATNSVGTSISLGGGFPVSQVVDAKIFAIDDSGVVHYRTYAAQKDAAGTVTGIDMNKSQDWKKL